MSDPRIDFWNLLHDGAITAAVQRGSSITLYISIGYLRRRIEPVGGCIVVTLNDVAKCEFQYSDGSVEPLVEAVSSAEPEILSTESVDFPATIYTTLGDLVVSYSSIDMTLDNGDPLSFRALSRTAREYWDEFAKRRVVGS
jgi:hypothetical protein